MNFPQFWAKGDCKEFSCWGWSNHSLAEAQALARATAEKVAALFKSGRLVHRHYGYGGERPLREPVLRELKGATGEVTAVITRNAYGCQVLNTAQVMFVDVDLPESKEPSGLGKLLKGLFGGAKPSPAAAGPDPAQTELLAKAGKVAARQPEWGWRIYRTRAGFRLLATHQLFDPVNIASDPLFDELGADPLYRQLCRAQKCFRARLTPKPWRCKSAMPPVPWPWADAKKEQQFKEWETRYLGASRAFATCELVATLGNTQVHESIAPILAIHDETSRVGSNLPLA